MFRPLTDQEFFVVPYQRRYYFGHAISLIQSRFYEYNYSRVLLAVNHLDSHNLPHKKSTINASLKRNFVRDCLQKNASINGILAFKKGSCFLIEQFFTADVDRLHHQIIGRNNATIIRMYIRIGGDELLFLFGEDDADVRDDQPLHISGGVR